MFSANQKYHEDVRRSLIESLYASSTSLGIGAAAGFMVSLAVAFVAGSPLLYSVSVIICLIAVGRTWSSIIFNQRRLRGSPGSYRGWERAYELGAWSYAAMLGVLAFAALQTTNDPVAHLLAVALASGYAGGISARNAGRVQIAAGQVALALAPTSAALVLTASWPHAILGIVLFLTIVAMWDISFTTHRILLDALTDRKEKAQLATKFELLARFDALTGVENRMAMQSRLQELLIDGERHGGKTIILWFDLDRFKEINDSLGHLVGDELLRIVTARVRDLVDGRAHLARFGGDEFILLCPGMTPSLAESLGDAILQRMAEPVVIASHQLSVSCSIGMAIAPDHGATSDDLLQHADTALYEAKRRGRNCHVMFNWALKERFNRVRDIENGLREAIENNALDVHYQPIIDTRTGVVTTCEALVRWVHPQLGNISPAEFIPIAETTGVIGPLTEYVIRKACHDAAQWPNDVRVAINICPVLLKSPQLARAVVAALMEAGLSARRMELEVTESLFLSEDQHIDRMLQDLRRIGVGLSLDDFGTGYSSLSYLRHFRFDTLKIDQSFMRNAGASLEDRAVIGAISFLAQKLEMETVAEGIETEAHLQCAIDAGFTHVQGYLFCVPQPAAKIAAVLNAGPVALIANRGPAGASRGRRKAG